MNKPQHYRENRPYTFFKMTMSTCPECLKVLPVQVVFQDNQVFFLKHCPEHGASQALVSEVTFKNGRVQQDNYHQFEIVRMNMAPKKIVVHMVPSSGYDAPLGGVGEPGVPVIAPLDALSESPDGSAPDDTA